MRVAGYEKQAEHAVVDEFSGAECHSICRLIGLQSQNTFA
jgi:hypothetical protein